jgi:ligand-binding sensor domain-containing protein/anti-sigma regulatory factor (Ser/Thr protein kinase)
MNMIRNLGIIIAIFAMAGSLQGQPAAVQFERLSLEQGISHNLTNTIYQDSKGFLWFGTMFGLIRYDGYRYKTYRHNPNDPNSLSHNDILCLIEDRHGRFWIGTRGGGLNRLDPESDQISRFRHHAGDKASISSNYVRCLEEDRQGRLWIGAEYGLNLVEHPELTADSIRFRAFNMNLREMRSLSNNIVNSIFADRNGALWIGTNNGLNRFDEATQTFTRYFSFDPRYTRRPHSDLLAMLDNLYKNKPALAAIIQSGDFTDSTQVFTLNRRTTMLAVSLGEGRNEFLNQPVEELTDYGWIESSATHQTIWRMNFKQSLYAGGAQKNRIVFDLVTLPAGTYRLHYISDDSHSFAAWNNHQPDFPEFWGIQLFAVSAAEAAAIAPMLKSAVDSPKNSVSNNRISFIAACHEDNILWIGTLGGGLNKFDTQLNIFKAYRHDESDAQSLASDYIHTIYEDTAGCSLWIGTENGVSRYDSDSETFANYYHEPSNPQSLSSNSVYAICRDQSGIMWFGTYWGGIDKLDNKRSRFAHIKKNYYAPINSPENNIFAAYSDSAHGLWLGSWGDGLLRYDPETSTFTAWRNQKENPKSLSFNFIRRIIAADRSGLWIGTYGGGLNHFDPEAGTFRRYQYNNKDNSSLSNDFILSLLQDRSGRLWVGTEDGLNVAEKPDMRFNRILSGMADTTALGSNRILSLYQDSAGRVWIGTSNGLSFFDDSLYSISRFRSKQGITLGNEFIHTMLETKRLALNNLWLGTSFGLVRLDLATNLCQRYTEQNGLPSNVVYGILEDERGFLWLSTNKGLSKFNPALEIVRNYDLQDGLQSNMFNADACCNLPGGELFFGGINGFNIFHPEKIISNTYIPSVYITGFRVFDQDRRLPANTSNSEIVLSHEDNFFTIEFSALDYTNPAKNHYNYRLNGVDKSWVLVINRNFASYTNVPPGRYVFEVMGSNSNGVWNKMTRRLSIVITPPFYLSGWFKAIVALLMATSAILAALLIRIRERRKASLNRKIAELKLKALRAQMNPHFIFNTLNSIQYYISVNDQKSAYLYLSKFSRLMRLTLDNSERSSIPLEQELEMLRLYLELQQLRFEDKFDYSISVALDIPLNEIEIPTMILQPLIENSVQHGIGKMKDKGHIDISLEQRDNTLVCSIEDNGVGINKSLEYPKEIHPGHKSAGINLIRERLNILGAVRNRPIDVQIFDLEQENNGRRGTRVILNLPLMTDELESAGKHKGIAHD